MPDANCKHCTLADVNKRSVEAKALTKFINASHLELSLRLNRTVNMSPDVTVLSKYAVFVMAITCPPTEYDMLSSSPRAHIEFKVISALYP